MKIFKEGKVYVQKVDLLDLKHDGLDIPDSIDMKFRESGSVFDNPDDKYEFVLFDEPYEIDFFKSLDFIIDYDSVKDLSDEELFDLEKNILNEKNAMARILNSMSLEEKQKNFIIFKTHRELELKYYSFREYLWFKQGYIKYSLPRGVEYPIGCVRESGIKKLIRDIFDRRKR